MKTTITTSYHTFDVGDIIAVAPINGKAARLYRITGPNEMRPATVMDLTKFHAGRIFRKLRRKIYRMVP